MTAYVIRISDWSSDFCSSDLVVFNVSAEHGYDGLLLATLMAGVMLVAACFMRFGTWIKYIPEPVVTGFTAGIAVIIFTSQLKDLFGLATAELPAEFLSKMAALWAARDSADAATYGTAAAALENGRAKL